VTHHSSGPQFSHMWYDISCPAPGHADSLYPTRYREALSPEAPIDIECRAAGLQRPLLRG